MISLEDIARTLGGKIVGGKVRAPGRDRSAKSQSLSISLAPDLWGGIYVYDFRDGMHLENKNWVLEKLGFPPQPSAPTGSRKVPVRHPELVQAARAKEAAGNAEKSRLALAIWNEAVSPYRTPVERYLNEQRGVCLPPEEAEYVLRFHPECPFKDERVPAMVALVRNIRSDQPMAIHRTALDRDGRKVKVNDLDRMALGSVTGGAIKLTPDEAVNECLGIGEGIESVLSMQRLSEFGSTASWSLISAGGIDSFPVLPGLGALWIAVDNDQAGISASNRCAQRFRRAGVETFLVTPRARGADLNDFFQLKDVGDAA